MYGFSKRLDIYEKNQGGKSGSCRRRGMSLRDQAEANRHFYLVFIGNFTDGFFGFLSVLSIYNIYRRQ
jgi:hypothetical protein